MIIENRRKKDYSEKLFLQLCIIAILYHQGQISFNVLRAIEQKRNMKPHSYRSYNRYIQQLKEIGLLQDIKLVKFGKVSYLSLNTYLLEQNFCYYLHLFKSSYEDNKFQPTNQRECRLLRCLDLLFTNYSAYDPNEFNHDEYDILNKDGFYDFDYSSYPSNISLRNRQRDTRIVKDVILATFDR